MARARAYVHTLCLATDFWSGLQKPKSVAVALASTWVTGLYATHWMVSWCIYLRMPSALCVQMITALSAPPDANLRARQEGVGCLVRQGVYIFFTPRVETRV